MSPVKETIHCGLHRVSTDENILLVQFVGIMVGTYQMTRADGTLFNVVIPAFSLDSPHTRRSLN